MAFLYRPYPVPNESVLTLSGRFTLVLPVPNFSDFSVGTQWGGKKLSNESCFTYFRMLTLLREIFCGRILL